MADPKAIEVIYEEVVRRFELENERTRHLDDKANNIIGFVGILTGILSGFGAITLKTTSDVELLATFVFFSVIAFLIFSFICALSGYRLRKFTVVPDAYFLIGAYEEKEKERILRDLNANYAVAIEDNTTSNDRKVAQIKRAMHALFIAILLIPIFVFLVVIS